MASKDEGERLSKERLEEWITNRATVLNDQTIKEIASMARELQSRRSSPAAPRNEDLNAYKPAASAGGAEPTLRKALEPFAKAAEKYNTVPGIVKYADDLELWQNGWRIDFINVGDLRRAREAVALPRLPAASAGGAEQGGWNAEQRVWLDTAIREFRSHADDENLFSEGPRRQLIAILNAAQEALQSRQGPPASETVRDKGWLSIETAPHNRRVLIEDATEIAMAWWDRMDNRWYYAPQGGIVPWMALRWQDIPEPHQEVAVGSQPSENMSGSMNQTAIDSNARALNEGGEC